ncbi:MAG: hypothetical protein UT02_C0049G0005 [Parcubacteria group bacterium GW2011_GWC2_38_7]|nr:MAG: hypothetical protein UT02_C0049G0005 [Parcubacteria group bacterium GW2011_GWC2_38_7]
MSKFILHGGATRIDSASNSNFFQEIAKDLPLNAIILGVYFACLEDTWDERFNFFKERLIKESGRKDLQFILAKKDLSEFVDQTKKTDVIYLHGGETPLLKEALSKVDNFAELLRDKVVAGSSAGVYVLSKYYYSNDYNDIFEGLNILPIKSFCHYNDSKKDKLELLKKYKEDLPVYAIPEEKFFVIEK